MRVWLVRYIVTDQQGDHIVGIFDSKELAEKAKQEFEKTTYLSSWRWVDIEGYELNDYYPEDL